MRFLWICHIVLERTLGCQEHAENKSRISQVSPWLLDLCPMIFFGRYQHSLSGLKDAKSIRWDLDLSNHSDKSVGSFFVRMGVRELAAPRSSLLVLNSMLHASHSQSRAAVFPFAEHSHVSFGWRCFADASMRNGNEKEIDLLNLLKHLLHSGTEEENQSDKDSYLAAVLLLRVRSGHFDISLSGRIERSAWAKVQDVSTGVTPTNAATRLQALHRFLHIGAVTVLRSKTNLIEALTNHPWKDRYWQFHPLQCYLWPMSWGIRHTYTHHHQDTLYTDKLDRL